MAKAFVIEASSARNNFAQLSSRAKRTPVKVTRHGKVEFVVISPDLFDAVEALDAAGLGELERMQAQFDSMFKGMQSGRSTAAYDSVAALSAGDLARSVAKAYKRDTKLAAGRPKIRVVR